MATRYLSPTGNDGAAGTQAAPWRTFSWAISDAGNINKLQAGDTLVLLDGTYTPAISGVLLADSGAGANSGISEAQRITVRAQNERKAIIEHGLGVSAIRIVSCNYWTVEGIITKFTHIEPNADISDTYPIVFFSSTHGILRRCILYSVSPTTKRAGLRFDESPDGLVEENEILHCRGVNTCLQLNGSLSVGPHRTEARRNYINIHPDIAPSFPGDGSPTEPGIVAYPGTSIDLLVENNIIEGFGAVFQLSAFGVKDRNRFLGNIGLLVAQSREEPRFNQFANVVHLPQNTIIRNHLSISHASITGSTGIRITSPVGGLYENITLICPTSPPPDAGKSGFVIDNTQPAGTPEPPNTARGFTLRNTHVQGYTSVGFAFSSALSAFGPNSTGTHLNAIDNGTNFSPATHASLSFLTQVAAGAEMLACPIWVPNSSPLSGSGSTAGGTGKGHEKTSGDGASADKGATILYAYEGGELTTKKLWNPATGQWAHMGAVIPGINDTPGASLFDVHTRLGVSPATLPASYVEEEGDFNAPILDTGARANEGPPPSSSWLNLIGSIGGGQSVGIKINNQRFVGDPLSGLHTSYWAIPFAQDQQVRATLVTIPVQNSLHIASLFLRLIDINNYYRMNIVPSGGVNNDQLIFIRQSSGVPQTLFTANLTFDFTTLNVFGFRIAGPLLEGFVNGVLRASFVDPDPKVNPGHIGLGIFVERGEFIDFGGGPLSDVTPPSIPIITYPMRRIYPIFGGSK